MTRMHEVMLLSSLLLLAGNEAATAQCDMAMGEAVCASKPYCRWVVDPKWAVKGDCWVGKAVIDTEQKYEDVVVRLQVCGKDYSDKALEAAMRRDLQAIYAGVEAGEIERLAESSAAVVGGVLSYDVDTYDELLAGARREMSKAACTELKRQYRAIIK